VGSRGVGGAWDDIGLGAGWVVTVVEGECMLCACVLSRPVYRLHNCAQLDNPHSSLLVPMTNDDASARLRHSSTFWYDGGVAG
jgi:hypothetical protein